MGKLTTSESVSRGHADKICDQISDAILDALLIGDPNSKVAVETLVKDNMVVIAGEVTTKAIIDYKKIVKEVVSDVGYSLEHGFHPSSISIINLIGEQSPEINNAVIMENEEIGSGDQGFMVSMATNETDNYMPLEIHMAKKIIDSIIEIDGLGPDIKSQVTTEEIDGHKRIHTILVSTFHSKNMRLEDVRKTIINHIKYGECKLSE